jgi:hypothetical protein
VPNKPTPTANDTSSKRPSRPKPAPPATANTPAKPPRLRWWKPAHGLLLLWWLSFDPGKIAQHDNTHGKGAHKGAGSWLANTLAWIPLFILTLALAARPDLAAAWNNELALSLPAYGFPLLVLVPYLLLTGIASAFGDDMPEWLGIVAVIVAFNEIGRAHV